MLRLELEGRCYNNRNIEINPGVTVLTGPNGSGKTFACTQIRDYLKENGKEIYYTDIYDEGKLIADTYIENGDMEAVAKYTVASEGQRVFDTFIDNHTLDPNNTDNSQKRWQFVNDIQNMLVYYAFTNQVLSNCSLEFLLMVNTFKFMIEKKGIYHINIDWNNFTIKSEVKIDELHPAQINFINNKYNINIPLPKADEEKANADFCEAMQEINSLLSANGISQIGF